MLRTDLGRLVRIDESDRAEGLRLSLFQCAQEHSFFFAHQPGPWALGTWTSDADFLYWSFDREKEQYMLVLCNGSYADAGGHRVLTCEQASELC